MTSQDKSDNEKYLKYYESYIDCTDNLPSGIQKQLTRIKDMDVSYAAMAKPIPLLVDELIKKGDDACRQKLLSTLLCVQDVQLFKLETIERMRDTVKVKSDELERGYNLIDSNVGHVNSSPEEIATKENSVGRREQQRQTKRSKQNSKSSAVVNDKNKSADVGNHSSSESIKTGATKPSKKVASGVTIKKKCKSLSKRTQKGEGNMQEILDNAGVDHPDEPIYCLCDRVSYGQMICCDNDLCPIEWFHFDCVSLTAKPKGKWFCPKCRGDRPNVMKRKSVFLKELEKYNKEKEEKASRRH